MPATVTTSEIFPISVNEAQMDEEVRLRVAAGAIRSNYERGTDGGWNLTTEWNVIGEQ